jgi:hypothetical protein
MGTFVKISTPVVANGKVYVNMQLNVLPVYGLLCQEPVGSEATITLGPLTVVPGTTYYTELVTISNEGNQAIGGPFTSEPRSPMNGMTRCIIREMLGLKLISAPLSLRTTY